jgi:hypothetical protein
MHEDEAIAVSLKEEQVKATSSKLLSVLARVQT